MSDETKIHGVNPVQALLESGRPVSSLWVLKGRHGKRVEEMIEGFRARGVPIQFCERTAMDRMADGGAHQGVIARCAPREAMSWDDLLDVVEKAKQPLLVILDGVEDPHNLGAIMRSAEAFGALAVILPKDRTAPLNAGAIKASAGAAERLDLIRVTNLARAIEQLQQRNVWVIGLAGEAGAPLIGTLDCKGPLALVMGNEGSGLRRLTRERCDQLAAIPMGGGVGSLNVSVATGVALYEVLRQRAG
ncbi:23S rRNA Gm-2251 2'-O-methyltransferase [Magnetococcus marinus MC-1]|uniref:23S rRNA Gm-2251 2'-O-methyltransferase n=1 Tax=Magnetococcus marinus (strain ATCC BAA-1437 / JCM 17883 / MC-1) TaxID=156889 RepID=A0L4P9_MAGMM|nr:23S rRNA (guanosine(2251)-2'-O)-methyltransferase RlmB [Magnetococcus marinus]ABK42942.1 23S rRNA Gm-2251 2'-O-methyltransferase [Magnetococcus marinus MC-1]